jgi:hypothetical protein
MRADPMERLAAADPIDVMPTPEPPERLRCLIEGEDQPVERRHVPREAPARRRRWRLALGSLTTAGVCLAALALSGGSSGPELNVAAAAYAATSPGSGIVEAVFIARRRDSSGPATLRQQEWLDAATGQRRELDTLEEPRARPPVHQVLDQVFAPRLSEEWDNDGTSPPVRREHVPPGEYGRVVVRLQQENRSLMAHIAFAGIGLDGIESVQLFRDLYRKGWIKLVGKVTRRGRQLWKLESRPVYATALPRRRQTTRLVVLVDPQSFLPILETQVDVSRPGHPRVTVESELVSYRRLTAATASPDVFDLAAQHPHARVVVLKARLPKFTRLHKHGAG